ncbi:MAG TPA: sodium:solute symporter family protein [Blastocatellia bacterium]|nr:sodium:solute symporter family protein [Blastocatellia bacterium]
MKLGTIDIIILIAYLAAMIGIGVYVTKRASQNLDSYFLGSKSMPWWLLGISNASAMWDVTGTMWFVTLLFTYGMKAAFLPWLWPIFNQVFEAVYLSKWTRRSNARTGAEWITTRFGPGRGGELSRAVIVLFAVVGVVAFIGYEFQGIGKFCQDILPWDLSPSTYALILMGITAVYVVLGGMLSVVLTDFTQFVLMALSGIVIGGIALMQVSPGTLDRVTPAGWQELAFGWNITLDWSEILPAMNDRIASGGMASMFGLFFVLMVVKGMLVSMAGTAPNYDMQRILATKTPREASLMSAIVSICLIPRWIMIGGVTLLALAFYTPEFRKMGGEMDFERVLPYVIANFLPAGLTGVLLAGLLASFMANFSATVNAGAAYLVNDLYKRYVNPEADNRTLIRASYLGSVLVLVVGMAIGLLLSSINQITLWIVSGLYGGYTAANVLKWYWWRLNGYGYFWGMFMGIASALAIPQLAPHLPLAVLQANPLYSFPFILFISTLACLVGSLMTEPEDPEILKRFYRQVRPWGFWQPVHELVVREDPSFEKNRDFARDMVNCAVGMVWQLTLVTTPLYLVFRDQKGFWVSILILITTSVFLKVFWYDHLESETEEAREPLYSAMPEKVGAD